MYTEYCCKRMQGKAQFYWKNTSINWICRDEILNIAEFTKNVRMIFPIQCVLGSGEIRTGGGTDGHGTRHLVSAATAEWHLKNGEKKHFIENAYWECVMNFFRQGAIHKWRQQREGGRGVPKCWRSKGRLRDFNNRDWSKMLTRGRGGKKSQKFIWRHLWTPLKSITSYFSQWVVMFCCRCYLKS